jgi:hypothetical protein
MLLPDWKSRTQVHFIDITEFSLEHPDAANFLPDRPFYDERFNLVFCDGQVLRESVCEIQSAALRKSSLVG